MPIVASDIVFRLSGGAANTTPDASLGGARSTAGGGVIATDVLNNVWDNVSGAEGAAGDIEYRCIYILNAHATLTYTAPKVWISADTTSTDDEIDIGLGSSAVNGTEQTVANESTAPTSVTFSHPTTFAGGLSTADLPPTQHKAIWIRRTVNTNAAAANANPYTLSIQGETAA
jgi:hypothetical protein